MTPMFLDTVKQYLFQRLENPRADRRLSLGRSILVYAMAILVAAMIGTSLWVSIAGITQKIKLVRGTGQIFDVVDLSRKLADVEHGLGTEGREDLLARLDRMGQIQVVKSSEGLETMVNPWGGALVAYTVPGNLMRLETQVSSSVCTRVIELLTRNLKSVGLQQINARVQGGSWRQIYVSSDHSQLTKNSIVAGCHDEGQVLLALTFNLR